MPMVRTPKDIFNGGCFLGVFESNAMTDDFFRNRLDQMIDLRHPLAVLANRMPWQEIEASLGPALGSASQGWQEDRWPGFVWPGLCGGRRRHLQCRSPSTTHPVAGGAAVPQACVQRERCRLRHDGCATNHQ